MIANCPICGAPLAQGMTRCSNCGTPAPGAAAPASEDIPYTYMEYAASQPLSSPASAQSTYAPSGPAYPYDQPQSYGWAAQPPPATLPVPPAAPAPPPRSRRGLIVGLVIVVALLILAGSSLLTYNFAVVQPAARANATATAQAAITATAYAGSPQGAYIVATSGKPEVTDSLNGQSMNEFSPNADNTFGGSCAYLNGAFHAIQAISHRFYDCPGNDGFSNFALQVQIQIQQGDRGGIVFRANPNTGALYLLDITTSGHFNFYIYKGFQATDSMILYGGDAPDFHAGLNQTNLVTLIARGEFFFLYVNKVYAGELSDNTYTSGSIGLVADNDTQYTDVAYTNLQIWNLS